MAEKPAKKLEWKKKFREIEWSYSNASNSLTNFWQLTRIQSPETEKDVNLLRIEVEKNSWNLNEWTYFVADFNAFGITVKRSRHAIQRPQARPRAHYGRRLPSVEDTKALTLLSLRTTSKKNGRCARPSGEQRGARASAGGVRRRPAI